MWLGFSKPDRPHTLYVMRSFRDKNGKSTTERWERLGSEEEIEKKYGCPDGLEWAKSYIERLNQEQKEAKKKERIELSPVERIDPGEQVLYTGGDMLLLPLFNKLGLPEKCRQLQKGTKTKYDLEQILEALVVMRVLYPCSKKSTFELSKKRIRKTTFAMEDVYRALTLLSGHIDEIQAEVWARSEKIFKRNTRVMYYDCTNYYFDIEDNDLKEEDPDVKGRRKGIRRRGKSKEHRPNPIVQMGMLMDADGIPVAFLIFPGNESEQPTLKQIEETIADKFGLNEFVISTDAGLSSEDNRRYNMTEGREYIAVQSLPKLKETDQEIALDPKGWKIAYRHPDLDRIEPHDRENGTYDLSKFDYHKGGDKEKQKLEIKTRFYKEIIVGKTLKGKPSTERNERIIVTYSKAFADYLRHKRQERLLLAQKIVRSKSVNSRQSQQDPRRYVSTKYVTDEGELAENISISINTEILENEERFDGFYAYGTSLDDDAVDVLRARSFHHEIEHLFRTTKSLLEARPVFLQREDRIKAHFLICFLALTILKMLQKQLDMSDLSINRLIEQLRKIKFDYFRGRGYRPVFERNELTDRLQEVTGLRFDTQIVPTKVMNKLYRSVKVS